VNGQDEKISRQRLAEQFAALEIKRGEVLVVHIGFRAVGLVEGGPPGLIAALLEAIGPDGTLAMPSWTGDDAAPFDPRSTPASADLGIVAETFRKMPGVVRSGHPFAFAALGSRAAEIVEGPLPLPPHAPESPIGTVLHLDGQILLLGCGQDANTTIHLGELLGGAPYRVAKHITVLEGNKPCRIEYGENDHCCARFALMDEWLRERNQMREGAVGYGVARLMRARDIVRVACEQLARDPLIFLHDAAAGCTECDAARASVAD
jgi:aminoglycoside N3'-acetyltransferase